MFEGEVTSHVVDWSADDRANLEMALARGPVIVQLDHCKVKILLDCQSSAGKYAYQAREARQQHETYLDEASLSARIPLGVASLAGHLAGSKYLDLKMTVVGQYMSDRAGADLGVLSGHCSSATHVITNISVGAFELRELDAATAGAEGSAPGAQVGAAQSNTAGWSTSDGDQRACDGGSDEEPPKSCRSPIRIRLVPLVRRASTGVVAGVSPSPPPSNAVQPDGISGGPTGGSRDRTVRQIAAGYYHTCLLSRSGGVECWGDNDKGQLGDGSNVNRPVPTAVVGLDSGVSAVSAGYARTCAVKLNGAVVCWGSNTHGELGDGTRAHSSVPVPVFGLSSGAVAVAVGFAHACALIANGAVQCWGSNQLGQLGIGLTQSTYASTPVEGLSWGAKAIAIVHDNSCAWMATGGILCWGSGDWQMPSSGTPVPFVGIGAEVSAIAHGQGCTCALKGTGAVSCWGPNRGQCLGNGSISHRTAPTNVSGLASGVSAIGGSGKLLCALKTNGGVVCWGDDQSVFPSAVVGLGADVSAISVGSSHACAVRSTGGIVCWGWNKDGQLGDGTTTDRRRTAAPVVGYP